MTGLAIPRIYAETAPPVRAGAVSNHQHDEGMPMAGTIRKRTWSTRKGVTKTAWLADYFDQKRKRHTKQFPTKKAADAWLLRARGEVRDGIHTPDGASLTIAAAGELWIRRCETDGLERATLLQYRVYLERHIVPTFGRMRLAQLTPPDVEAFRDELLRLLSRPRALGVLSALKGILGEAQRRGHVVYNAAQATRIDIKKRERELLEVGRDIPSQNEVNVILASAAERWRPVLVTAAFTGMRASELRGLPWDAVDFENRIIRVRQRADAWGTLGAPKTAAGRREIPMARPVLKVLREWRLAYPFGTDGILFCSLNRTNPGGVLGHTELWKQFRQAQLAAGVVDANGEPKYHFHALRHFFASAGIAAGFAPKRLQALLGHASITMTYDVYGHLFPDPDDDHAKLAAIELAVSGARS
ncbi:MAG TPA: site-specific integrase [Acidocella sp.]|nr:site-specific integrase [Acidocella sp.]